MASQATINAQPLSLEAALERIAHLEAKLALAQQLVREQAGLDLQKMLSAGEGNAVSSPAKGTSARGASATATTPPPPPSSAAHTPSAPSAAPPSDAHDNTSSTPAEPVDVGPFVLRALDLRKRVHLGVATDADAEADAEREPETAWAAGNATRCSNHVRGPQPPPHTH